MSSSAGPLSRRQVLAMAAAGAGGAVALRTVTLHLGGSASSSVSSAAGANGSWASPLTDSRALAAHLLRRAGFGYTDAELDVAASTSYPDLVDKVLSAKPDQLPLPEPNPTDYRALTTNWYRQMATTRSAFPERMALFWHGHLTSDYRKGGRQGPLVWQQNQLLRNQGRGDLRGLLVAITHDPLMMYYLDLVQSSGKAPNENFSRELMELYALGVGNYSETDVREGARALSGLQIVVHDASGQIIPAPRRGNGANGQQQFYADVATLARSGATWKGVVNPRRHDAGSKSYLGRSGNLGPDEVIDTILAHDACAPFIAAKALGYFSVPSPARDYVTRIAAEFRSSHYDIGSLMRAIFLSPEFKDPSNYRSLVRSPADLMVATMRALGRADLAPSATVAGTYMNQILYDPPTVAGWPTNAGWVSSSAWLGRVNFAALAVETAGSLPDPLTGVKSQLDNVVGPSTAAVFNASRSSADRWYTILASPEFQLK